MGLYLQSEKKGCSGCGLLFDGGGGAWRGYRKEEEGASRITSFLIKKIIFFTCNPSQRKITIDTTGGMPAWPINNDVGS